jgi:hypothetical protein
LTYILELLFSFCFEVITLESLVSLVLLERRKPNFKSTINAFLTKDFMNELDKAIEGYNQEKMFIVEDRLDEWHKEHRPGVYEYYKERIKQIDTNIERLLTLKYYPNPEKSSQ